MALTTILAGYDLSGPSDLALERAIAIARLNRAKMVLVHAQASETPQVDVEHTALAQLGEVAAAIRDAEARRLADKLATIRSLGLEAEVVSKLGPPDEVLAGAAHDERSDLIVVGTHGHTGVSRFLLGSVANTILRRAPCDVLVVRGDAQGSTGEAAFHRPLIATDFSPAADQAIDRVRNVLADGAAISLVHAWELPAGSWGATLLGQTTYPWSMVRDAVLASARAQADKLVAARGGALAVELVQGPPASVITDAAAKGGHDLIVVGSHGHRGFRRLLLGSVAESVVRHAPCSVLVSHGA